MVSFTAAATLGLAAAAVVNAAPAPKNTQFPFADGFPNPSPAQLGEIEDAAFGTLSDAPPPATLSSDTKTSVQLVNFNENAESEFFRQLVANITENKPGFNQIPNRDFTLKTLKSMQAVEELHAINAANALKAVFKSDPIQPCIYQFPVNSFDEAIAFISRITDFVQGVLGDVIEKAAAAGDAGFTQGVAGALSNEGEQDGWFRFIQGLRPNAEPFNTIGKRDYAFSILQDVAVPGSCPNAGEIDLKVFQPLTAGSDPAAAKGNQDLTFTFSLEDTRFVPNKENSVQASATTNEFVGQSFLKKWENEWKTGLFVSYLNGQDAPISEPVKSFTIKGSTIEIVAEFPFSTIKNPEGQIVKGDLFGLSVAALTDGSNFATSDAMVNATLRGPALLETIEPFF